MNCMCVETPDRTDAAAAADGERAKTFGPPTDAAVEWGKRSGCGKNCQNLEHPAVRCF